jgi:hypothetical protein
MSIRHQWDNNADDGLLLAYHTSYLDEEFLKRSFELPEGQQIVYSNISAKEPKSKLEKSIKDESSGFEYEC